MGATITGVRYGLRGAKRWDESTRTVYLEYDNTYSLLTESDNDATNSILTALANAGVLIGAGWAGGSEINPLARCIGIDPVEISPLVWEADVRWSTRRSPSEEESQEEENAVHPTDRTPKWRWSGETIDLLQVKDAETGEPLVNAVGEPFYAVRPYRIHVLTITRYLYEFDPDVLDTHCNRTNETEFWGKPAGVALLWDITDDPVVIDGEELREVVYTIKFNSSETDGTSPGPGWKHSFSNEGTKYKEYHSGPGETSSPFIYKPFLAMGQPTTGNLNLDGEALADGDPPYYLDFNQFPKAELNDLKLGPTVWS